MSRGRPGLYHVQAKGLWQGEMIWVVMSTWVDRLQAQRWKRDFEHEYVEARVVSYEDWREEQRRLHGPDWWKVAPP